MCACKETDVRESPNVSIFAGGEGQGGRGETGYSVFVKSPFPRSLNALYNLDMKLTLQYINHDDGGKPVRVILPVMIQIWLLRLI
jgi:hypothetical protein